MKYPHSPFPKIGEYTQIAKIHQSGMAKVSLAQHPSHGLVVVKQAVDPDSNMLRLRIAREADVLKNLHHPQLPTVIEDATDQDVPYFVMSREKGSEGVHVLKRFSLPVFAGRVAASALKPLGYVHENGLIHRDVKPRNFLVQWSGRVTLLDFGVVTYSYLSEDSDAEVSSESESNGHRRGRRLTSPDGVVGTVAYVSPDRRQGKPAVISDDIYSMGISLYEMLYGELPHSSDTGEEYKVARSHLEKEIDFTVPYGRRVPDDLIEVIDKATQKDPKDRYQTAPEMLEDLERYLSVHPRVLA